MSGLFPEDRVSPESEADAGPGLFAAAAPEQPQGAAAYRVLARKYRPARFADLIGQDAMVRTLRNAFALGRIAHAFMLTGVRGVGKTTTARIIARALNCTGPDGTGGPTADPCGVCPDCRAILADRHPDVIEIDAASRTGVDDVREIIEATRFRPLQARTKVYVVDEVHMLSRNAFNALLKTLEEPPPHVKFVFATTDPRKVPVTVLSRCQRFDLRRVPATELAKYFQWIADPERENVEIEPEALWLIARAADGSVRDGLSLLDQAIAQAGPGVPVTANVVIGMLGLADRALVFDLMAALFKGIVAQVLEMFDKAMDCGADPGTVLQDLLEFVHTVTRVKTLPAAGNNPDLSEHEFNAAKQLADGLSIPVLGRAWQMLLKGIGEVEAAPDRRVAAEMVLIRLCHVADLPPPGELVRRLSDGTAAAAPSRSQNPPSGGARALAQGGAVAVAPMTEPAPRLASLRDVAGVLAERREAMLHAHLMHSAHLVHFAPPVIELRIEPEAPRDFAARLAAVLQQATATRWTIALSAAPGEPTLAEQDKSAGAARRAAAGEHPLVRAILEAFPGARVEMVPNATDVPLPHAAALSGTELPPLAAEPAEPPDDPENSQWEQER